MNNKLTQRTIEQGQGLVEYALIIVLVGIVVIVALSVTGSSIKDIYCQVVIELDDMPDTCLSDDDDDDDDDDDVVVITRSDLSGGELHLDATSDGDFVSGVTLTASPGGTMEARSNHYHKRFNLSGCPCVVTVTSSAGGSASVTVP